jgi:hypothetical protein
VAESAEWVIFTAEEAWIVKPVDQMAIITPAASNIATARVATCFPDIPIHCSIIRSQPEMSTGLMGSGRAQVYHNDWNPQKGSRKQRDAYPISPDNEVPLARQEQAYLLFAGLYGKIHENCENRNR